MGPSGGKGRSKKGDHTINDRMKYAIEDFFSQGGKAMFISLILIFVWFLALGILIRGLIDIFTHDNVLVGIVDNIWMVFMQMIDPGSLGEDEGSNIYYRLTAVFSGIIGVALFSMLIAFITTHLDILFTRLKKGKSRVIEKDHILILGWNERVPDLIDELMSANKQFAKRTSVVILSEKDKEEMDDELSGSIKRVKGYKIVTRNGLPSSLDSLERISARDAKAAIILASCSEMATDDDKQTSDARVIKTLLALISITRGRKTKLNMIAELFDDRKRETLDIIKDQDITSIDSWNILGKILVQTSMSTGLATVYDEILSFKGADLKFVRGKWVGRTFKELVFSFPKSIPLGVRKRNGELILRPNDPNMRIGRGESLLLLSKNDPKIEYSGSVRMPKVPDKVPVKHLEKNVNHHLILGWHPIAAKVIKEYHDYLRSGSGIDVMMHNPSQEIVDEIQKLEDLSDVIDVKLFRKNPMDMDDLISMNPSKYDSIIILSLAEGTHHPEKVDSETLVILLLLRKVFSGTNHDDRGTKLITQVMNSQNQDLIARTEVDDFIISNRMITKLMAQVCEDHTIMKVFDDLFSEEGSEIYLKPAYLYFSGLPKKMRFIDILAGSLARNEICVGVGLTKYFDDPERNFGIMLVPPKDAVYELHPDDRLVVLAENEL